MLARTTAPQCFSVLSVSHTIFFALVLQYPRPPPSAALQQYSIVSKIQMYGRLQHLHDGESLPENDE